MNPQELTARSGYSEEAQFMTKVYGWMAIALLITGIVSYLTVTTPAILQFVFGTQYMFLGLVIGELVCVGYLIRAVRKMSALTATWVFLFYAGLNGLTLSVVFLAYTMGSVASTFFITAGTFGIMSAYGYFTKKDLTSIGNLAFMALIGLIIASIVNWFMKSTMLYWITTFVGILIFVALTAYDTQKIKRMHAVGATGGEAQEKASIIGALMLYLDFINLFLMLLRLFGRRR